MRCFPLKRAVSPPLPLLSCEKGSECGRSPRAASCAVCSAACLRTSRVLPPCSRAATYVLPAPRNASLTSRELCKRSVSASSCMFAAWPGLSHSLPYVCCLFTPLIPGHTRQEDFFCHACLILVSGLVGGQELDGGHSAAQSGAQWPAGAGQKWVSLSIYPLGKVVVGGAANWVEVHPLPPPQDPNSPPPLSTPPKVSNSPPPLSTPRKVSNHPLKSPLRCDGPVISCSRQVSVSSPPCRGLFRVEASWRPGNLNCSGMTLVERLGGFRCQVDQAHGYVVELLEENADQICGAPGLPTAGVVLAQSCLPGCIVVSHGQVCLAPNWRRMPSSKPPATFTGIYIYL